MAPGHAPPGWPEEVPPPGVEGWEGAASAWLLDGGPPAWRTELAVTRYPVVLARLAADHAHAQVAGARAAWAQLPALADEDLLPDEAVAAARGVLGREGPRLAARAQAVELVGEALRGAGWTPRW